MKGSKCEIFGGLAGNLPTTAEEFVTEATKLELASGISYIIDPFNFPQSREMLIFLLESKKRKMVGSYFVRLFPPDSLHSFNKIPRHT